MNESKPRGLRSRWVYAVAVLALAGVIAAPALVSAQSSAHGDDQMFTSLPICTIIDSRNWTPSNFGGDTKPQANTTYTFDIRGETQDFSGQGGSSSGCGVPNSADVVLLNILAVNPDGGGNMKAFPEDQTAGDVTGTVINYNSLDPNVNLNNAVAVLMDASTDDGDISIRPQGSSTHIIGTVLGYFQNTTDGFYTKVQSDDRFSIENAIAESSGFTTIPAGTTSPVMIDSVNVTVPDRCSPLLNENWDFEVHATGLLDGRLIGADSQLHLEDSNTQGNFTWIQDPDNGVWSFAVHELFTESGSGTKTFELWADNVKSDEVDVSWELTAEAKDVRCTLMVFSSDGAEADTEPEPDKPNPRERTSP